ncbi:hypothetical protein GJ496_004060 [Pomphorhynchus laevis]|nr:hypothetical protein GJ496_004060 [Pomphorhynchus laevis]
MVTLSSSVDTGHEDMVHDACLDFYGARLATCSSDRTIRIFDVSIEDASKHPILDHLKGHKGPVWQVCWSHPIYDSLLASASQDGTVRIWQEISGRSSWIQSFEYKGHKSSVNTVCFAPYQHGLMLAAGSSDGSISILFKDHLKANSEWQSKLVLNAHEMGVNSICWGPLPYLRFVSGGSDGVVKIWSPNSNKEWTVIDSLTAHKDCVRDVAWSPSLSRSYIASCGQDMNIIIWQEESSDNSDNNRAPGYSYWVEKERIKTDNIAWTVSWCMSGTTLAIAGQDNRVRFFKEMISGQFVEISPLSEQPARNHSSMNVSLTTEMSQNLCQNTAPV